MLSPSLCRCAVRKIQPCPSDGVRKQIFGYGSTKCVLLYILITIGYWTVLVKSQCHSIAMHKVTQVRHGLIPNRLQSVYGSDIYGNCTLVNGSRTSCNGTSVLNDGVLPMLSGVSNDSESQWAAQLFTLKRPPELGRIVAPFELEDASHDRVELAVFNCPKLGISTPEVNVYFDSSFRPGRYNRSYGDFDTTAPMENTSCDQLIVFCVKYNSGSSQYINLEFPFPSSNINSTFVFLGEVTFLNGNGAPCPPPKLVTEAHTCTTITTKPLATDSEDKACTATTLTAGVVSAVITALLVAGISVAIHIAVYQCLYKPRLKVAVAQGGTDQRDDVTGDGDAILYDVVDERVVTGLKIKQSEAYGIAKSI